MDDEGEFGVDFIWFCKLRNGFEVWLLEDGDDIVFLLGIIYINFVDLIIEVSGFFDEVRFVGKGNDEGGGVEVRELCWRVVDVGVRFDLELLLGGWMLLFLDIFLEGVFIVMENNLKFFILNERNIIWYCC